MPARETAVPIKIAPISGDVELVERQHVGEAERAISGQHVGGAEDGRDGPLPPAPVVSLADDERDHERRDGQEQPEEHDAVAHGVRGCPERPEGDERDGPDERVGNDQDGPDQAIAASHGVRALCKACEVRGKVRGGARGGQLGLGCVGLPVSRRSLVRLFVAARFARVSDLGADVHGLAPLAALQGWNGSIIAGCGPAVCQMGCTPRAPCPTWVAGKYRH